MADFALLATQARTARKAQEWSPGDRVEVKGFDAIGTIRYCKTRRPRRDMVPPSRGFNLSPFRRGSLSGICLLHPERC